MKATVEDFETYIEDIAEKFQIAVSKVKLKHELLDETDNKVLLPFLKEFREMTK